MKESSNLRQFIEDGRQSEARNFETDQHVDKRLRYHTGGHHATGFICNLGRTRGRLFVAILPDNCHPSSSFISLGPDFLYNGSRPSLYGSPRNLHTKLGWGQGCSPSFDFFSPRPLKNLAREKHLLSRTAVNCKRITSKRFNISTNEYQMFHFG